MPSALIRIDQPAHPSVPVGQPGRARDDLVIGQPVTCRNANNVDVNRWIWLLVDKPIGSAAVLSGTTSPTVSFTPDIPGSYLVRLVVNDGLIGEFDEKVAAVRDDAGHRFPATGETLPAVNWPDNNGKGWGKDLEGIIRETVDAQSLAGTLVVGNKTLGRDIELTMGDSVIGENGGSITFDGDGDVVITAGIEWITCDGTLYTPSDLVVDGDGVIGGSLAVTVDFNVGGDASVGGKLSVAGLIDPSGLVLDEQVSCPFTPPVAAKGTLWTKDVGGTTVLMFTTDAGVDTQLANMAGVTLTAVLTAGNTTGTKNIVISNGDQIQGADGGSISFEAATGLLQLSAARAPYLLLALAELAGGATGATDIVIGPGDDDAPHGTTIISGTDQVGSVKFTDTPGTHQGAVRYDQDTDRLYFDAGGGARFYIDSTGVFPNATATYDIGSSSVRPRDTWLSRVLYAGGGVTGHSVNASDMSIGDGSATPRGATFHSTFGGALYWADTVGGTQGGVAYVHSGDTLYLIAGGVAIQVTATALLPDGDGVQAFGSAAKRWTTGFFNTAVASPLVRGTDFGAGSGAGGAQTTRGGDGGTTGGVGGAMAIRGGNAQANNDVGGTVSITSGDSHGNANAPHIELTSGAGNKIGLVRCTNTCIEIAEAGATPGVTIGAGYGRWWVKNTSPTSGWFTDSSANEIDVTRMPTISGGVGDAHLPATNPATKGETTGTMPCVNLANAATQNAHWWKNIPRTYLGGNLTFRLWWTGTANAVGNAVRFQLLFDKAVNARDLAIDNSTTNGAGGGGDPFIVVGPTTANVLKFTDWTLTNTNMNSIAAGDLFRVQLRRLGSDAADNYTGTVSVIGWEMFP